MPVAEAEACQAMLHSCTAGAGLPASKTACPFTIPEGLVPVINEGVAGGLILIVLQAFQRLEAQVSLPLENHGQQLLGPSGQQQALCLKVLPTG